MPYWICTDVGLKRSDNEDALVADEDIGLFGVADGMGGHAAGAYASQQAVQLLSEHLSPHRSLIQKLADPQDADARTRLQTVLTEAMRAASRSIHAESRTRYRGAKIGTTFCGALVSDRQALIVHAGDSRAYLCRGRDLYRLTHDHTLVNEQLRRGMITEEQAENSPYRHILVKAIGIEPTVVPDIFPVELRDGDRLLFCTDGVSGQLVRDELAYLLRLPDGAIVVRELIDAANKAGGDDNATVVLLEIGGFPKTGEHLIDPSTKIKALWQLPMFHHLEYAELAKLIAVTTTRVYQQGETVFHKDEPGDVFLVVIDGSLDVMNGQRALTSIQTGEHVGELALLDGSPRSASVMARERTQALLIQREDFYKLITREPTMAAKLLWRFGIQMARRIRELTARLQALEPPDPH